VKRIDTLFQIAKSYKGGYGATLYLDIALALAQPLSFTFGFDLKASPSLCHR
jgi:hypothetical protein